MSETRASYTVVRDVYRTYCGAIRRRRDDGVIWECVHGHARPFEAQQCAQREWRRRIDAERRRDAGATG